MTDNQNLEILKKIIPEQKHKMLNRIYYTLAWMGIVLLLLVINTLTVTIHLVDNPLDLIIFFYFLLIGFSFWGLELIFKNYFGWKTLNQLLNQLRKSDPSFDQLNQIKSHYYFFNNYYKTINQQLGLVINNSHFCFVQNNQNLQKQKWNFLRINLFISILIVAFLVAECLYFQGWNFSQWTIIFGFTISIIYFAILLPWLIFRQIFLNLKYNRYLNQKLDDYDFVFTNRWLLLKSTCEKLEVKDGN